MTFKLFSNSTIFQHFTGFLAEKRLAKVAGFLIGVSKSIVISGAGTEFLLLAHEYNAYGLEGFS